jgi:SAM-dependent methyltransferase
MHRSSFERMKAFRDAYVAEAEMTTLNILDVGAASIEGASTYRELFATERWSYVGLDTGAAPNVDLVAEDPYHWRELADASFDVVVSGQAFEHIEWPWLTIMEISRVLKPAGFCAITAPSGGHVHRYPTDCWRYYPDGLPALAKFAGLSLIENDVDFSYAFGECAFWGDAFAIMQKPLLADIDAAEWDRRRNALRRAAGRAETAPSTVDARIAAPFRPGTAPVNALLERTAREQKAGEGFAWRWKLARQHLRAASRALLYPVGRLKRQGF